MCKANKKNLKKKLGFSSNIYVLILALKVGDNPI